MNDKKVVIYSTPTCHFCQQAKAFFAENNVEYVEKDVSSDQNNRQEMIDKSGQMGVPVIFVDDEMTIGFDEGKLRSELGI